MQKIIRPIKPPAFLTSERVLSEKSKILSYLRREDDERRQRRDSLDEDIFFSEELLRALRPVFHEKCAFCEVELRDHGIAMHFRPLRFGHDDSTNGKDYYLWFAFEWRNLFYVCAHCAKSKGDNFPIAGERTDFLSTFEQAEEGESALLIDPTAEDPGRHLRFLFNGNVVPETDAGGNTIRHFDLNRQELIEARRRCIDELCELVAMDDASDSELRLRRLISRENSHSGALQNVLRRALKSSRLVIRQISSNPDTFARRFPGIFVESGSTKRLEFLNLLRAIRADEDHPQPAGRIEFRDMIARAAPSAGSAFSAVDRELVDINISNFKAIRSLDFSFKSSRAAKSGVPSLMILGENSTGKSSVLAATALALVGRHEARKLRNHFSAMVHRRSISKSDSISRMWLRPLVMIH
jgi:uncharacterized protein (TIGR02646 family)